MEVAMLRGLAAVALVAFVVPLEASANSFGRCAQQGNPQLKIAACTEASTLTSYPRVLRWIYREMARAHRERGEIELARLKYLQSLAAQEDEVVRREMQELPQPLAAMPGMGPNGAATHPAFLADISALTVDSDFTVFMRKDVPEDVRRAALRRLWVLMHLPISCDELCYELEPGASGFARIASEKLTVATQ
jgi:uncharacterized protein DUF3306